MKVVINTCYGGFGLSDNAFRRYLELKGIEFYEWKDGRETYFCKVSKPEYDEQHKKMLGLSGKDYNKWNTYTLEQKRAFSDLMFEYRTIDRADLALVQVVEELGMLANGEYASLSIVEVPDDVRWTIQEYDGIEHIAEVHRAWY
jgi:hypothetical protein